MLKFILTGALAMAFFACTNQPSSSKSSTGLKKIRYGTPEELQKLRTAGAEIIVQQSDYVIVRVDSGSVSALAAVPTEPVQESDLVQRFVHIKIDSSHTVQQIVDAGVDFWQTAGDTAVGRAYDIQLERLRQTGFEFRVVVQDENQMKGEQE